MHNVAAWLPETLTSILAQDVENMEVIVVDDHSIDDSAAIAERFAREDPRLRVVRASLFGGGNARNTGVDVATGRYLVFSDGDDIVPDGAYRALVASLESSGSDVAFGDFLKFSPADTWRPTASMAAYQRTARGITLADEPTLIYARPCWNKVFRREYWDRAELSFPNVPRSNDILPMTAAYTRAAALDVVSDVVYLYRERPGGGSMTAKASSSPSMLSYLAQEIACARLIADYADDAVSDCYARLVWDRDTFHHVANFALAGPDCENADTVADPQAARATADELTEISESLTQLLQLAGASRGSLSLTKRLVLQFAAADEWAAAQSAAALEMRRLLGRTSLSHWACIVEALERIDGDTVLDERSRWLIIRELQAAKPDDPDDPDAGLTWLRLADATSRAGGQDLLRRIPEIGGASTVTRDVIGERRRVHAVVDEISARNALVLRGSSAVGPDELTPVLWGVDEVGLVIAPDRVEWERSPDPDGAWRWCARFPVTSVPMHRRLQFAARLSDGPIIAAEAPGVLPVYSPLDTFVLERHRSLTVLFRRRSIAVRMVRRAAIIAVRGAHSLRERIGRRAAMPSSGHDVSSVNRSR